jgi:hypothetical protein
MSTDKGCPNCGIELPDIAAVCPCGYNMDEDESGTPGPGIVRSNTAPREVGPADGMMQPARQAPKPKGRSDAARHVGTRHPSAGRTVTAPAPSPPKTGDGRPQPNRSLLMGCPSCDASISRRAPHCPRCGAEPFQYCLICAERIIANAPSCPACGDPEPFTAPRAVP